MTDAAFLDNMRNMGQPVEYRRASLSDHSVSDIYESMGGVTSMARAPSTTRETVSWALFQWIVGLLLAAIGAVLWFHLSGIRDDLNGLKKEITEFRVETVKAIGAVREQAATTNAKLDAVIQELRNPRR